jgi:hypothetical protein
MGERKLYKVLVGKPEEKKPLGRPRRRWEDGIIMDLMEIGLGMGVWIGFNWLSIGTGGEFVVHKGYLCVSYNFQSKLGLFI